MQFYLCSLYSIFTYPSTRAGYDTRSVFKQILTGLNSEYSFSWTSCLTKTEEPCLSYYLPIDGGRIIWFIPFPRVFVLCEMQSVSSRIWTRVTVSISYDINHYTTVYQCIWGNSDANFHCPMIKQKIHCHGLVTGMPGWVKEKKVVLWPLGWEDLTYISGLSRYFQ